MGTGPLPLGALILKGEDQTNGHKGTSEPSKAVSAQGLPDPAKVQGGSGHSRDWRPGNQGRLPGREWLSGALNLTLLGAGGVRF